jgi:rhodanese-related sulfurtransferase
MTETNEELPLEIDIASVQTLVQQDEPMLLLDCREQNEYDVVRLEGATLVPMSEREQRAGELDEHKDGRIVVYCHFGGRSLQVAAWLRQRGMAQTQSMSGGIDQWAVDIDPSLPRY